MLSNYPMNPKSLKGPNRNSHRIQNIYNQTSPSFVNYGKVARPVYIPPPQYKYSLTKSPQGKNSFGFQSRLVNTPSTNLVIGTLFRYVLV